MAKLNNIFVTTRQTNLTEGVNKNLLPRAQEIDPIINRLNSITDTDNELTVDTINEYTSGSGVTIDGVLIKDGAVTATGLTSLENGATISTNAVEYTVEVTLSASEIVGTGAGQLGHADGAVLVAAPGADYALQFVNAVLIYDYDTAAYTGGAGDDLTVYINSVAVSPAIATADLITKAGDTVINLSSLSAGDYVLGVNSTINLASTAVTQPGTAAGVIRAIVTYRRITTGL
jgi:hypothetical protein